ncbi:hypothetical protein KSD_93860 [Ktedonobacter sp. SOSP1-85]|nr:hypothetical protein KSD_93860 [Ktedonobacter sp. SOSP1-85]
MKALRFWVPLVCILFGLYALIWSLLASSTLTPIRISAVFFGILFLLLAFIYLRIILPTEQKDSKTQRTVE